MKSIKKMPLVILTFMVLGIASITIYYFNTRETENFKLSEGVKGEVVDSIQEESKASESVIQDKVDHDSTSKEEKNNEEIELADDNNKISNKNVLNTDEITTKIESNNNVSNSSTVKEQQSNSSLNSNNIMEEEPQEEFVQDNTEQDVVEKEETIIEIPNTDNNNDDVPTEEDEEYKRIKATCEFETRAECHTASDIVGVEYAGSSNFKNTACQQVAYKGKIIGYRLQIFFWDGTWIYNN